jgi:hypothetical protein
MKIPPPNDPQWTGAAEIDNRFREADREWWDRAFSMTELFLGGSVEKSSLDKDYKKKFFGEEPLTAEEFSLAIDDVLGKGKHYTISCSATEDSPTDYPIYATKFLFFNDDSIILSRDSKDGSQGFLSIKRSGDGSGQQICFIFTCPVRSIEIHMGEKILFDCCHVSSGYELRIPASEIASDIIEIGKESVWNLLDDLKIRVFFEKSETKSSTKEMPVKDTSEDEAKSAG